MPTLRTHITGKLHPRIMSPAWGTLQKMLTDTHKDMLELAATRPTPGRIWEATRLSPTRYWQIIDQLARTRDAIEHDPMLCRRIRDAADGG